MEIACVRVQAAPLCCNTVSHAEKKSCLRSFIFFSAGEHLIFGNVEPWWSQVISQHNLTGNIEIDRHFMTFLLFTSMNSIQPLSLSIRVIVTTFRQVQLARFKLLKLKYDFWLKKVPKPVVREGRRWGAKSFEQADVTQLSNQVKDEGTHLESVRNLIAKSTCQWHWQKQINGKSRTKIIKNHTKPYKSFQHHAKIHLSIPLAAQWPVGDLCPTGSVGAGASDSSFPLWEAMRTQRVHQRSYECDYVWPIRPIALSFSFSVSWMARNGISAFDPMSWTWWFQLKLTCGRQHLHQLSFQDNI